jgi:2-phospho-L-lactate/phosphoenolpyruvate guanylyltransferase
VRARAVVPQKALSGAKSRLEGVLSAGARAALSLALLRNVCAALTAVATVESVVVMTPDAATRAQAAAWGIPTLIDPCPGLNAALAKLVRDAARSCAVLVVAADLPLLRPADVVALLAAGRHGRLVLAPSKEGTGTNAVVVPPGMPFHPAYGAGSLSAHRRGARSLGYEVVEVRRPGLAFDVDTEADLLAVRYCDTLASVAPTALSVAGPPAASRPPADGFR